ARILHGWGKRVHGSDRRISPITEALQAEGIAVAVGHAAGNVAGADLVLASSAVLDTNPELVGARERGIRVARRPEFLPELTAGYDVIAVAGAHGKTTVTGMAASVLLSAGLDPTYIVGGIVLNLQTNGHAGSGRQFVIEADEYRRTFLALRPTVAVVTNVEFDHPDCYRNMAHLRLAFVEFVGNIVPGGVLIACGDDPVAHAIAASYHANGGRIVLYGMVPEAGYSWQARDIATNSTGGLSFRAEHEGEVVGRFDLQVPGEFNVANALAVLGIAAELGIDLQVTQQALQAYTGTARRFEILGEADGVTVIDDYAHHPTQIRGVLQAARRRYGGRRLLAVWEPHTFSRIRALHAEFMESFGAADQVLVMPIYAAREADDGSLTAQDLALTVAHHAVQWAASLEDAVARIAAAAQPGDVVMLMGAGNETIVGRRLVDILRQRELG
ncbi:MAG: UDP-N-acetylmuramate--L-alanine ligase, partial [Anaerolineae bacterium]|nr:UDP-N-acetylmuramate--L-alanine ligase [Anaerolineae bacterium]